MQLIFVEKSLRRAPKGGIARSGGMSRYKGGQFIDAALYASEKARAAEALPGLLTDFDADMQFLRTVYVQGAAIERLPELKATLAAQAEIVPLSTVEARLKATIRNYYGRAFLLGKRASGNLTSATAPDIQTLAKLRADEYSYLRGFLGAMRGQEGRLPYEVRMHWYSMAAREVYNIGFVLGNDRADRWIEWRMGKTEHCVTCRKNAGVWRAGRLASHVRATGEVPKSGRLDCRGYKCGCELLDCAAPENGEGDH